MTTLTKEQLLRHPNRKSVRVDLPGRGEVIIREMTGLDLAQFINQVRVLEEDKDNREAQFKHMLFIAERTIIGEDGLRMFSDGELDGCDWSIKEAEEVYKAAMDLAKTSAEGNSERTQSGSSRAA